ncbi:12671_t:CDS:2 [Ambispora gerdemannii]|uniref:12671_t:CDS:1 n=1 Tax=Ambispora gerdemannii TaxID=144530 RepID=A0A9N8WAW1_9GLOM|nr:12671_t:CDS:2 [Ambispora gerdemannii]
MTGYDMSGQVVEWAKFAYKLLHLTAIQVYRIIARVPETGDCLFIGDVDEDALRFHQHLLHKAVSGDCVHRARPADAAATSIKTCVDPRSSVVRTAVAS